MAKKDTYLLLDGNALLHRAWHALPQTMTTSKGTVVNAAYGFTMIIERMLSDFNPTYMAVAWDVSGPTFRHKKFKEYKGHREKKEQELYDQIPIIQNILTGYGIPSISKKGFEADDVIGTIAKLNETEDLDTLIATGDLDALQLVEDDAHIVFFVRGISQTKTYDPKAVQDRYGLNPNQIADLKALMGDSSDNIPGLPGIGEKTAVSLLQEFNTIEGIFDALKNDPNKIKDTWRKKLDGKEKDAFFMRELTTIRQDVPIDYTLKGAEVEIPSKDALVNIFKQLEFQTLVKKYSGESMDKPAKKPTSKKKSVANSIDELSNKQIGIVVESKQEDLFGSKIATLALSDGKKVFAVDNPSQKDLDPVIDCIEEAALVVGHDVKEALHILEINLIDIPIFDTKIAAYLLNAGDRQYAFNSVTSEFLKEEADDTASQSTLLIPLMDALKKKLEEEDLAKVLNEIEMPLIPVLKTMERYGIEINTKYLASMSKEFHKELDALEKKIQKLAGKPFNVNSPLQLTTILFEDLGLPTKGIKKTKTGFSTAASELEKLEGEHKIIPLIQEQRELAKLVSTYIDTLPELVEKDGRIHTTFNQTIAATGRLSSKDPNLQNIPIRTKRGRLIRNAFIAESKKVLIAADYSQIELRLAAHIAKDEAFIRAFNEGADIHTRTAAEVWGLEEEKVTKDQRRAAKAVNFGILYGMGSRNLAKSTGLSLEEAKKFIDRYFEIHHAIKTYIDETKVSAHERGYVETLFGRKRYLPELSSGVQMLVAAAERMAINMPIQGTNADIIKLAMIEIDAWIRSEGLENDLRMLLQVHDELVFEATSSKANEFAKEIQTRMGGIFTIDVPLVVDAHVGDNWGEMKSVS